ncbi:60S ribosomal protein L7a-like [Condylostylus longicornis]|uniref:60S ribosomal protein L7a-like n=1 Tax=Condylostylus longicornis TaxID=2530218 RepID=UPI00244E0A67|nr:60S ribosomal protein L7a-like [Condylostylus longicornis]
MRRGKEFAPKVPPKTANRQQANRIVVLGSFASFHLEANTGAMVQQKPKSKKLAAAPFGSSKTSGKAIQKHPLFEKTPRSYRIGGDIRPSVDLSRYVRWPKYIRMQRQRAVLLQRLKVPPALNQFNHAVDRNQTSQLFRLLNKYKPESRVEKKNRLLESAKKREAGDASAATDKPVVLKYGLNHVTDLIELKKARLVVIAHDVNPVELVCWLPALCRKKDIPYCIVKSKARLGQLVHKKTASCVVVENVRKEDQVALDNLIKTFRSEFNDNVELRRRWGGGLLGLKSRHIQEKKEKAIAREQAKKLGL